MNPWIPSGTRPVKIPTNQAAMTANKTAMPQSASQMKCGMSEEEPEEDRQPVPLEVVRDDEVDRVRRRSVGLEDG